MAKRRMSAEARARIGAAQRRRWAAHRAGKSTAQSTPRRGRRPKSTGGNPYMQMTVADLVAAKRQLDEAWQIATRAMRGR